MSWRWPASPGPGSAAATEIVFGGPAKTDAELAAAVEADATVNVESPLELRRLAVAAETAGVRVRTALRVNRDQRGPAGSHRMTGTADAVRHRRGRSSARWSSSPPATRRCA